ncbi:MAG: tRNA 2-thiocytidine(32) synthetase TtcA [Myxococcota bacterium]|nr:tRNA 2-thiocytidine(32) synthetase TtcA [Myxococcota bacterium]
MGIKRSDMTPSGRRLARKMRLAIDDWHLLAPGDRVMVCVSGGKDSYTLLDLLMIYRARVQFDFSIFAVHLDQKQPGYDGRPLRAWLENRGVAFEIVERDTYSRVLERTPAGDAYCAVCSRLRRAALYETAERLNCNRVALGHHRDDALQTFMMNIFFAGQIRAMPATYQTQCGRFSVIRPLISCSEDDIRQYADERQFPILPCNLCGSQDGLKRKRMEDMLRSFEVEMPGVRDVMYGALKNVSPEYLLDKSLLARRDRTAPPPINGDHGSRRNHVTGPTLYAIDDGRSGARPSALKPE